MRDEAIGHGSPVELTPPKNAKWCPESMRGIKATFYLHVICGGFEHNDGKMDAVLNFTARGGASAAREGGVRFSISKVRMLKPFGKILFADDPEFCEQRDYAWHTDGWIDEKCKEVREHSAELLSEKGLSPVGPEKEVDKYWNAMNDFCAMKGHAFSQGIRPYDSVRICFWDPLHLDNNLSQSTLEMADRLAQDMAAYYKLKYDDKDSPQKRLHDNLRKANPGGIGKHADKLEKRARTGEVISFRHAGDDCIDWFLFGYMVDDALRMPLRYIDPKDYWWFRRSIISTRSRLHRTLAWYQVIYSMCDCTSLNMRVCDSTSVVPNLRYVTHKNWSTWIR